MSESTIERKIIARNSWKKLLMYTGGLVISMVLAYTYPYLAYGSLERYLELEPLRSGRWTFLAYTAFLGCIVISMMSIFANWTNKNIAIYRRGNTLFFNGIIGWSCPITDSLNAKQMDVFPGIMELRYGNGNMKIIGISCCMEEPRRIFEVINSLEVGTSAN